MKQVLQTLNGLTVVRDVPAPACPAGGVLVRNAFSVISPGTEGARLALAQKSLLAKARERPELVQKVVARARREGLRATRGAVRRQLTMEMPVGYSSAGRVVEVGSRAGDLQVGDSVACCGGGHANHAEIVAMPRNLVAKVPDGVMLEHAAFSTLSAIALHGIRTADVTLGERVAVVGCGLIGQLACRLLRAAGARVVAIDVDPDRVATAVAGGADLGATAATDGEERVVAWTGGVGVDAVLVIAAAATNAPLLMAAAIARDRGKVVLVGAVPIEFPRQPLYDKELSFRVSRSYGPGRYDLDYEERGLDYPIGYVRWTEQRNLETVLHLIADGRLDVGDLISEITPVDEAPAAYDRLVGDATDRPRGAIVLEYPAEVSASRGAGTVSIAIAPRSPVSGGVSVGLIGPGSFASRILVPALRDAGATLEIVGGGSGPSAVAAVRDLGFRRVAVDAEQVLNDPDVNAVVIASRHSDHAELSTAALNGGKSVFVEKPLALTVGELRAVLEAASSSPGILAVGFNRRFSPLLQEALQFLNEGGDGPTTMVYRVSAGKMPAEHWIHDLDIGGGRILGEVCHFVDSLRFLAQAAPYTVYAAAHADVALPIQAWDNIAATVRFVDGSVGTIAYVADGGQGLPKERLEAFRGNRSAVVDDYVRLELFGAQRARHRRLRTQDKGHRAEIMEFVRAVHDGSHPVPLRELEEVSLATLAVVESLCTGESVVVEPDLFVS